MPNESQYQRVTSSVSYPTLPGITDRRLGLFTGGHYANYNLSAVMDRGRVSGDEHVRMAVWSAPDISKPAFAEATRSLSEGKTYRVGDKLGPSWTNHWVKVDLVIPDAWREEELVVFEFDPNCEGLIYTLDGEPLHAITGGPNSAKDGVPGMNVDRRIDHIIPRDAIRAGRYSFYIEISINALFGLGLDGFRHQRPDPNVFFTLDIADIVLPRPSARALYVDFLVLTQLSRREGSEASASAKRALRAANQVMNAFKADADDVDDMVRRCREAADRVLGSIEARHEAHALASPIWAIGHCHIDTAWLWRYTQSQQKVARSWSSQLDLMERYPQHQFAASSAQQYAWLEELYPSLFKRVSQAVADNRFHPVGGSWIEHDCLLPSGESLCRQYLYGQRYFRAKFGRYSREAWLPDTFGYASQLPQVLRLAGIDYFFTQKLSWNNINPFPYSTFNWIGLDGSQVLSHMTPTDTYNAQVDVWEVVRGATKNKNLEVTDECLLLFGNGDGGGGPTSLMLEKRLQSAAQIAADVPAIKVGSPADFFDSLCADTANGTTLPTWRGELYFELHRGTYTSQAGIKRGNREMEQLLHDVELYATLASLRSKSYTYPRAQLEDIWRDILLNQFHDVIPGTSIRAAIDDALEIYDKRRVDATALLDAALDALSTGSKGVTVLDPLRVDRQEVVCIDDGLAMVKTANGVGAPVEPSALPSPSASQAGDAHVLENAHFALTVRAGRIVSLVDKALERELILPGPDTATGGFMLYEDLPLAYDAWDAEIYHLDCKRELCFDKVELVDCGPLRAGLATTTRFGKSEIKATGAPADWRSWIRVDVVVDWHEKHKFLKFALPVDVHAPTATYGTQYGTIDRPTHRNTTQDQAKFEVCAHGFADLSEPGYGVAIASHHKYGYAVEGNTMRISLLRSATAPDPDQDQGIQRFGFAIMPHLHRGPESGVFAEALRYNTPLHVCQGGVELGFDSRFSGVGSDGLVLDTVKRAEDDVAGETVVILRMYESVGARVRGQFHMSFPVAALAWVNILEEPMADEPEVKWQSTPDGVVVDVDFRGFEVKTLKVTLQ